MGESLEGLDGTISIADDVGVCDAAAEEHDVKLKCAIKRDSLPFFGNIYTSDGINSDPTKIEDVKHPLRGLLKPGVLCTWDVN